jgi:hypothetical protein
MIAVVTVFWYIDSGTNGGGCVSGVGAIPTACCIAEGNGPMFSADIFLAEYDLSPKNGPIANGPVNGNV